MRLVQHVQNPRNAMTSLCRGLGPVEGAAALPKAGTALHYRHI
jgi:hypothetical protein